MFFNIFLFFLYITFCFFSIYGFGLLFKKLVFKTNQNNIGETGLLGFLIIFLISILFHFFTPLFYWLNLFILIFGFVFGILDFSNLRKEIIKIKKQFFLITLIIFSASIILKTHADYEWYHLPYVNYLNSYKVIFGLVNLSNNYAYGHGWMDIMGIFAIPFIETKGLSSIALIFFYFFNIYFLIEYKQTKIKKIKIFIIILFVYIFANFNKLQDFGAEIQPTLIIFLIIFNFFKFIENKDNQYSDEIFLKIIIYFFFSNILRIGSIISLPIIISLLLINYSKLFILIKKNIKLVSFFSIFIAILITKNFIVSGCLNFPIYKTCFGNENIKWAIPMENAIERFEFMSAISKRWKFYSIEEGKLKDKYQYFIPMEEKIIMEPKLYNKNRFFWLKYWSKDHDVDRLLNTFLISLFCFLCFFLILPNKKNGTKKLFKNNSNIFFNIGLIISILMWFLLSPQMRYGGYAIIGGTLIYFASYVISFKKIINKRKNLIGNILILISVFYFVLKNVDRTISDYKENKFSNFPWPNYNNKIIGKDYETININNIKVNLVYSSKLISGEPVMCGSLDMPCLPQEREICISDIYLKNNYLFIENFNPDCLKQFRMNFWQH